MFTNLYNNVLPTLEQIYVMIIGIAEMPLSSWFSIFETTYSFSEIGFFTGNSISFTIGGDGLLAGSLLDKIADGAWNIVNSFIFLGIPRYTQLWLAMLLSMPYIFILCIVLRWLF